MLIKRKESMQQITDSDCKNSAMHATEAFKQILDKIQSSNLNFQIQVSPFSAQISLKKSLVKDRAGNILHPPTDLQAQSYDDSTRKSHDEDIENIIAKKKNYRMSS